MMWLSPDATPQQHEALGRMAATKIGLVVHVDSQHDFVMSPQVRSWDWEVGAGAGSGSGVHVRGRSPG